MHISKPAAVIAHNITPPHADTPILEFYRGYYDCVYILLHPFVNNGKAVTWSEFLKISGIKDLNALNIALRNKIKGLIDEHKNDEDLKLLNNAMDSQNFQLPPEGSFSDLLKFDMLNSLLDLNHEWIYVGDEFGFERKIEFIPDIIGGKQKANYPHETWYSTNNEILYATDWDSSFTFLCSDKKTVENILEKYQFEGFYCKPNTEVYWSVRSKI